MKVTRTVLGSDSTGRTIQLDAEDTGGATFVLWGDGTPEEAMTGITKSVTAAAATNLFTSTSHGYVEGDKVSFSSITGGAPIAAGSEYYVIASGLTANTFKVSTTPGGTEVDVTSDMTAGSVSKNGTYTKQHVYAKDGNYNAIVRSPNARIEVNQTVGLKPYPNFDPHEYTVTAQERWDREAKRAAAILGVKDTVG